MKFLVVSFTLLFSLTAFGQKTLSLGAGHSCAIEDGKLRCWGWNSYGQLGFGKTADKTQPSDVADFGGKKVKTLSTGFNFTCAVLEDESLKCFGWNGSYGICGLGRTEHEVPESPAQLPTVNLGTNRKVKKIDSEGTHSCALLDDKSVKCWGGNNEGELGIGDTRFRGTKLSDMGDALPKVALGTGRVAKDLCVGASHSCALLDDETVKCWGMGANGIHGGETDKSIGNAPNQMGDNLKPVRVGTNRKVKKLACGTQSTCVFLDDKTIKCWGINNEGQLGVGGASAWGFLPEHMGDKLPTVDIGASGLEIESFQCRGTHCCVSLENSTGKCWGGNSFGQLGVGDAINRGLGVNDMGENLPFTDLGAGSEIARYHLGYEHTCVELINGQVKCFGKNLNGQGGWGKATPSVGTTPFELGKNLQPVKF